MGNKQAKQFSEQEINSKETYNIKDSNVSESDDSITLNIDEESALLIQKEKKNKKVDLSFLGIIKAVDEFIQGFNKIKVREKATFFRLFSVMNDSGISTLKSLKSLSAQTKNIKLRKIIDSLAEQVEEGGKLSDAMAMHPDMFNQSQVGMVASGETSGQLTDILKQIALELEKNASINAKIKGALIYPVMLLLFISGIVFFMMIDVIPKMTGMITQAGGELPDATKLVISISNFTQANVIPIIVAFFALIFSVPLAKKFEKGKYFFDLILLKLPIFGSLVKKSILAKFSRSLGNLISSGISIVKALNINANAVGNEVYKKRILLAAEDLKSGISLGVNLKDSDLFPDMVVNMISIGEKTAQLDSITKKIAKFYDEEVDEAVKGLSKAFEPLILILVGVVVGGIVAAIMMPIINLTDLNTLQ